MRFVIPSFLSIYILHNVISHFDVAFFTHFSRKIKFERKFIQIENINDLK